MKLQVETALASLACLILIQQCLGDDSFDVSGGSNWTCTCFSTNNIGGVLNSNCSISCDCRPVDGDRWACTCPADGYPKVTSRNTTCFTSCNCTAGSLGNIQASKKHISSKAVVLISLMCIVLTTLAFLASVIFCIYIKDKFSIPKPVFVWDRETSFRSGTKLLSRKSFGHESNININPSTNSKVGCFDKVLSFSKSQAEIIHSTIIKFSYSELEHATEKFLSSNIIGLGGSSYVYRGQLKDGRPVAIKRLKTQGGYDEDCVFSKEVELLSRLHHFHVVPFVGYCSEFRGKHPERLLVFDYMMRGNLRDCLDEVSGENINWDTRIAIAIGAARGLEYLHEAAAPRILHRDVKSTNILLDENWRAKITDLGMAKCLRADGVPSCSSSPARMQGTFGYFAPEYAIVGRASLMSDVFSFGVVLLELITGRQPIHKSTNKGEESLVIWATPRLQDSRRVLAELPDPRLKGNFVEEEMHIMAYLAKECLLLDPDSRPTMREVVQILSTIAGDKSRRNIPVYLYQMPSSNINETEIYIERPKDQVEPLADSLVKVATDSVKEQKQVISVSKSPQEADLDSIDDVAGLLLLTSNARSWHVQDDDGVDLIEPRFESFCVGNTNSSASEINCVSKETYQD